MKNKIILLISIATIILANSCELFVDIDTSNNKSIISTKPSITLNGDPIMSIKKGDSYSDPGVKANAGDTTLTAKITDGAVDPNVEGFYVVTYEAQNGFGWKSYAYRSVLVYDGEPYSNDIAGTYKFNNIIADATISKHPTIPGYWQIDNAWGAEGSIFPIIFADLGNDEYGIVPGVHPTKGKYSGVATVRRQTVFGTTKTYIKFTITAVSSDGIETTNDFEWLKL